MPLEKYRVGRVLLREQEILARVDVLAKEIQHAYGEDSEITIVALLNGCLIFAADLLRRLTLPTRLESLAVESYHASTESSGVVTFKQALPNLQGREVLVVDDILDTGRTLAAVVERVRLAGAISVRTCVLLKKRRVRAVQVEADFWGFEIDDVFVVGYGLDYAGRLRNLPSIAVLEEATH
jgi:hypoxanthine phosphoribosyltransferase